MTDVLQKALAKAAANSSAMVQAGTKESYDNPLHQNHLKRGGVAKMKDGGKTNWIAGALKKPGSFTKQAKAAGKSVHQMAEAKKDAPGKTGKRARLALTFEKMAKK